MVEFKGMGKLLRVFVGADDRYKGKPLFEAIVLRLREIGLAGATVLRGIEGFGANSRVLKTSRLLRLSEDLPILVEVVDSAERIEQAITVIEEMLAEVGCGSLMTLEKVEIIRYKPGE
jgi:PII-like signaling protein